MNIVALNEAFTLTKTFGQDIVESDFGLEIHFNGATRSVAPEDITFTVTDSKTLSIQFSLTDASNVGKSVIVKLLKKDTEETAAGDWFKTAATARMYVRDTNLAFTW